MLISIAYFAYSNASVGVLLLGGSVENVGAFQFAEGGVLDWGQNEDIFHLFPEIFAYIKKKQ